MAYNEALDLLDTALEPPELALLDNVETLSSLSVEEWDPNSLLEALESSTGDVNTEDSNVNHATSEPQISQGNQVKRKKVKKPKSGKNKARDERRFVLIQLQEEVTQLQFTLGQLQSIQGKRRCNPNEATEKESGVPRVWKGICSRQFARRLRAERENIRLKQQVEKDKQRLKSFEKLLYKRRAHKEMDNEIGKITRRTDIPAGYIERMAAFIFEELSAGVEDWYRQVGSDLEESSFVPVDGRPLLPGGMKRKENKFFDKRVLPFSMRATSEAWWLNWHIHRGIPVQENGGDIVAESFGVEMNDVKAKFAVTSYGQQILWRHRESDRTVLVWKAYMEPFVFENERVSGVYFLEQCYVLIKPGEDESSSSMSTCYVITPYVLDPELGDDPKANALIDFFVGTLSSTIKARGEAVEDLLLDQVLLNHTLG